MVKGRFPFYFFLKIKSGFEFKIKNDIENRNIFIYEFYDDSYLRLSLCYWFIIRSVHNHSTLGTLESTDWTIAYGP